MILFIVPLALWLWNQAGDIATGVGDFLRSIPSLIAPKPIPLSPSYTPPFTGGQVAGIQYRVFIAADQKNIVNGVTYPNTADTNIVATGKILGIEAGLTSTNTPFIRLFTSSGVVMVAESSATNPIYVNARITSVVPLNGALDNGGNLPNPNPTPPINDDGLFKPTNPYITDSNDVVNPAAIVLAPALPLVLVPLISSAIAAALSAARAAATALEAIQKVAEALEGLGELWEKLKEFLDEWEKNRPKKRDITRQTYGRIEGDGALDFFAPNSKKVEAVQLDVIVTNIPVGFGRYFGNMSPSRYRYKELGYIAFYSVNQGILEIHSLQFKRSTLQIPPLAVGFIYHFGLDNQIKAFAFGTFSIEKT